MMAKRHILGVFVVALVLTGCAQPRPTPVAVPAQADQLEAKARQLVELLASEKFADAASEFNTSMTQALPPAKLAEVWQQLKSQAGAFTEITATRRETAQGNTLFTLTSRFERTSLDVKVAFDSNAKVAGLFFAPSRSQ